MNAHLKTFGNDLIVDPVRIMAVSRKQDYIGWSGPDRGTGATIILDNGASIDASPKAANDLFAYLAGNSLGAESSSNTPKT